MSKYIYKSTQTLRNHEDVFHDGLRKFEYNFCEKKFTQSSHRKTHIKLMHSESHKVKCGICQG